MNEPSNKIELDAELRRIETLLNRLNLPTRIDFNGQQVMDALAKDKKRESDLIKFVLLEKIGKAVIQDITIEELNGWIMSQS